jgi:hypothetical protein
MGRTACTEPQCLYIRAIPLLPLWAVRPVQSLSACTRVHFTLLFVNSELKSTLGDAVVAWVQAPKRHLFVEAWENYENKNKHNDSRSLGRELNPGFPDYEGETRHLLLTD